MCLGYFVSLPIYLHGIRVLLVSLVRSMGIMTREGGSALAALDAAFAKAHYQRLVPAGLPPGETAEVVHCHDANSADAPSLYRVNEASLSFLNNPLTAFSGSARASRPRLRSSVSFAL